MLASLIFLTVLLPIFHAESTSNSDTSVEYEIVLLSEHYHDNEAFTQGLEMYNGSIYESTGLYGSSSLREVDPWSGQVIRSVALNDTIFSEGITVYNETIIMLTWKSETAYVFDIKNLTVVSSFSYQGEGWGICYDGEYLIMSNGTSSITIRDPDSFNVLRVVTVTD
ncbi:MAG: glutaminyl-peptide cyclotransferase, partial [Candidatus Thermoplasmatota archaeon]|nr:glutaminyl-peptide cyclotransferase [Candidatus Thermoplasmatota archaeon]